MIYISNEDNAQLLNTQNCFEALDEAFPMLAAGRALSRPRMDVWAPCDRADGYFRWGSMEGVIETMMNLWDSKDSREALRAFVEKRPPVYIER